MNQTGEDNKWLQGLECARKLNFTDAQYEEAIKEIKSPDNANQLLDALIDISSREDLTNIHGVSNQQQTQHDGKTRFSGSTSESLQTQESTSSYYSSLASFPSSSSDQSLENLQHHDPRQQQQNSLPSKRKIYIDGANVARTHGKHASFSWTGIILCVQWFVDRQHQVKVFVESDRCHQADEGILSHLDRLDALVRCPSGCNDDMFVIEAARQNNGVIVSNDLFRDEKLFHATHDMDLQRFIENNRLPYVFVDDLFIPASDPLGRTGPTIDEFLQVVPEQHPFAFRTRSYQRNPRLNICTRQYSHSINGRRRLHSTRSLPIGQSDEPNIHQVQVERSQYQHENYASNFDQRRSVHRPTCGLYKSKYPRE